MTTARPRLKARTPGAFYLLTIIMGVFAEVFVRGALVVRDDAVATATNIMTHEPLYRFGLDADLIMLICYVAVTLLFYELFRPVNKSLSLLAAFFGLVGVAVLSVNALNHLAPLVLLGRANYLSAFETVQLQALALKAKLSRWLNIVIGAIYTVFVLLTMPGAWAFYIFLGSVDIILTLLIVWHAWNWPRQQATSRGHERVE